MNQLDSHGPSLIGKATPWTGPSPRRLQASPLNRCLKIVRLRERSRTSLPALEASARSRRTSVRRATGQLGEPRLGAPSCCVTPASLSGLPFAGHLVPAEPP